MLMVYELCKKRQNCCTNFANVIPHRIGHVSKTRETFKSSANELSMLALLSQLCLECEGTDILCPIVEQTEDLQRRSELLLSRADLVTSCHCNVKCMNEVRTVIDLAFGTEMSEVTKSVSETYYYLPFSSPFEIYGHLNHINNLYRGKEIHPFWPYRPKINPSG